MGFGDTVTTGAVLAEAGNSGHSGEPHLHIHVQRDTAPDAPLRVEPLPVTFDEASPSKSTRLFSANGE